MISQFERYGFLGELKVSTYRNLFKNDVPSGLDVFGRLLSIFRNGNVHESQKGFKKVRLHEFAITNEHYAELLFQMTDPSIPDNVLSDRVSGGLRIARRTHTEDPAVSAHVVIHLDPKHDKERLYPACIENIEYLPRTSIVQYLNEWMAAVLTESRTKRGESRPRTFQPRLEFVAPPSQTIQQALDRGGVLRGVKWVEDRMTEQTFGDKAYPVEQRTDVALTVKNRPTRGDAKNILRNIWSRASDKRPRSVKIIIEDTNDRVKVVGVDPSKNNVLSNIFIPQAHFDNFAKPIAMCEEKIRKDLIRKMKASLVS